MQVVRLGPLDVDDLLAVLEEHMEHGGGDLFAAYDPIDEAIKVKVAGRWSRPLGKVEQL